MHLSLYEPALLGAVKVPVPPLPAMLPVSNFPATSVRVCGAESLLVTVTFSPGLTLSCPVNLKLLIVMPPAPCGAASVVGESADGVVEVVEGEPVVVDDEPQEVRTMATAAPAASAYGFITITTGAGRSWFSAL